VTRVYGLKQGKLAVVSFALQSFPQRSGQTKRFLIARTCEVFNHQADVALISVTPGAAGALDSNGGKQEKMRLKSKATALVALMVLTATPSVFDRMADLKDRAAERFRTEVLNVFWNLTTPETTSADAARQYSELLARAQQQQADTPRCEGTDEIASARITRATNSATRNQAPALDLEHRQPFAFDEPTNGHPAADAALARSQQPFGPDDAILKEREDVTLVARNFKDYPVFDEFSMPVEIDDAVAQFEFNQTEETAALPEARPAAYPAKPFPNAKRFTQRVVYTNFQVQLPEKLDGVLNNIITNTDALIKARDAAALPPKPKCRVRVLRLAPEAPRPLEKPAIIS
jgi:hypothetical protein